MTIVPNKDSLRRKCELFSDIDVRLGSFAFPASPADLAQRSKSFCDGDPNTLPEPDGGPLANHTNSGFAVRLVGNRR